MHDFLDARASVDWAVSQFPSLQERLDAWLDLNVSIVIKELDANTPNNVIVAVEKEPLPRAFTVEVGLYINAIRSALDILATTLAQRYGITGRDLDGIYFPIAASAAKFGFGDYKGAKLIKLIPAPERAIIESLNPYKGGNDTLWTLHHLDIARKHKRLIGVEISPAKFRFQGMGFTPIASGWMPVNDETVLGLIDKMAPKPKIEYAAHVVITEADPPFRKSVIPALDEFADCANLIIDLFDT